MKIIPVLLIILLSFINLLPPVLASDTNPASNHTTDKDQADDLDHLFTFNEPETIDTEPGIFLPALSLGDLFVLDRLFSGMGGDLLNPYQTTLGDLFVLDQLFNEGVFFNNYMGGLSLGDLFVLDHLFRNFNSNLLNPDMTTLGDLFILDQLFNGG